MVPRSSCSWRHVGHFGELVIWAPLAPAERGGDRLQQSIALMQQSARLRQAAATAERFHRNADLVTPLGAGHELRGRPAERLVDCLFQRGDGGGHGHAAHQELALGRTDTGPRAGDIVELTSLALEDVRGPEICHAIFSQTDCRSLWHAVLLEFK